MRALTLLLAATAVTRPALAQDFSSVLRAIDLPRVVADLLDDGISADNIVAIIEDVVEKGIPAGETTEILSAASDAVDEHGPVDNFGAFVRGQLDAGLRGRELAQAIREEHARQGGGRGAVARGGQGRGQARGQGRGRGAASERARNRTREIAEIANEIKGDPSAAGEVLENHGMTEEEFDDAIFEITVNVDLIQLFREIVN